MTKQLIIYLSVLIPYLSFGQQVIVIDNKSFLNGHVDSIKISYGKHIESTKLTTGTKCNFILGQTPYDTLTIYPNDYIPLRISGLKSLKGDTVFIANYGLYQYCANDTIFYTHEKKKVFGSHYKKHSSIKVIPCAEPTNQVIPNKNSAQINNLTYDTSSLSLLREGFDLQIGCGKRDSYSKVRKHYGTLFLIRL